MQGFNMGRYYPPSADEVPKFNKSHPLGARANKIGQGILTVRFEMPFAIWCTSCPKETIIGQGVRFNAEKKRVGNYYSSPIFSFRMKHAACGGWIEIRTDPKSTQYVVAEGAKRRDYGDEEVGEGELLFLTEEERERRRSDAFAALEGKANEKQQEKANRDRIGEIKGLRDRQWDDPFALNQKMRRSFRIGKRIRDKQQKEDEGIKEKFSLDLELAEKNEDDSIKARLVEFENDGAREDSISTATSKALFDDKHHKPETALGRSDGKQISSKLKKTKAEIAAERHRELLQQGLKANTRATMDPFLNGNGKRAQSSSDRTIPGLKRKRPSTDT